MQAERTFALADLVAFAELSGDFNPLHVNPVAARRTQLGECVAHGIFVLLWALDRLQIHTGSNWQWTRISARFLRPVRASARIVASAKIKNAGEISLAISEAGRVLCQCELTWACANHQPGRVSIALDELPRREKPVQLDLADAMKAGGILDLYWPARQGKALFPALAGAQRPDSLAAMLAMTRVIGMKVPGEHSVFIQFDFTFEPQSDAKQPFTYRVAEYRKSSRRLGIAVESSAGRGMLWALFRPAPVVQPVMATITQRVLPRRFQGRRIIVIGGSRGLGELGAKVLAAGGAEVALSYRMGGDDAHRVVADIVASGGRAVAFQLDIAEAGWEANLSANCTGFDHLGYFATPPLVEGDGRTLDEDLFKKFFAVYAAGLVKVVQWLARSTSGKFALFNASTVAVQSPPLRNLEYAAAKAASEACSRWLAGAYPRAHIHVAQFPRLNTDQTASFLSAGEHDNLETVLGELSAWLPE
jgi:acyl dehydratase/NAD(P)-dependent dehydrogenase (short-subunit alcohol dehydrogenase family)